MKELLPFSTAWMDLESIMLNEISQVVKNKYYMISLNRNLLNKTNNGQNRTRCMETRNRLTVTRAMWGVI